MHTRLHRDIRLTIGDAQIQIRERVHRVAMTSEEDCLDALRKAKTRLGESSSKERYEQLDLTPSSSTIIRVVGGWNEAKRKAGLKTSPSSGSRVDSQPGELELPSGMDWNELSADQRWHYRNREWNTTRTLERRAANRAWLYVHKRDICECERCGEDDPACLEFHHLDSENKEMAIGEMISYGYSRERVLEEMQKCNEIGRAHV